MTGTILPPVVAIDGPTASGKGTVSALLAQSLGYHYLDSGAIYRVLAVAVMQQRLDPDHPEQLPLIESLAQVLPVSFVGETVLLEEDDVSADIRTEEAGIMASRLAALGGVRQGLLQRQRDFRLEPGLVADGRDMASVVFPDALVKVFLTASAKVRAERRYRQLQERGLQPDFDQLVADLEARDKRDSEREFAPLKPAPEAIVLDCSDMDINEVVASIKSACVQAGLC